MIASRLLIAAACSLTVLGAAGVAWAQTTTPTTPNPYPNQGQSPSQMQVPTPGTTSSDGTTSGSTNSTTQLPSASTMDTERAARADRN